MRAPDVVVVGGGSAGAVVASRLSENPDRSVLLLEAGPDWRSADAPAALRSAAWSDALDVTVMPQHHRLDYTVRRHPAQEPSFYWRGLGLGGCSLVNQQLAVRPPLDQFDQWKALGASTWDAQTALRLYCRSETDQDFPDAPYHGASGPTPIERARPQEWGPFEHAFRAAALEAGYPWCDDINAPGGTGVFSYPFNNRGAARVTSNDAYLEPARDRPNLTIVGGARVDVVLFDGEAATGVRWQDAAGDSHEVRAGQVVLSAGSFETAAILQRSGIGPEDVLDPLGIEVRLPLPVGRGAQDHAIMGVVAEFGDTELRCPPRPHTVVTALRYDSGLGGAPPGDMNMIVFSPWSIGDVPVPAQLQLWQQETFSRGSLAISSRDPAVPPTVCLGLYEDRRDRVRMRDGIRRAAALLAHPEFKALGVLGTSVGFERAPLRGNESDDELDALILAHTDNTGHLSSTCPMGTDQPVVDDHGRVLGVERLGVADLSVAPTVPRSNPHLTATIIGEHFAELFEENA